MVKIESSTFITNKSISSDAQYGTLKNYFSHPSLIMYSLIWFGWCFECVQYGNGYIDVVWMTINMYTFLVQEIFLSSSTTFTFICFRWYLVVLNRNVYNDVVYVIFLWCSIATIDILVIFNVAIDTECDSQLIFWSFWFTLNRFLSHGWGCQ
jgi:hypothetical protein